MGICIAFASARTRQFYNANAGNLVAIAAYL
jgi:hypothetical protein